MSALVGYEPVCVYLIKRPTKHARKKKISQEMKPLNVSFEFSFTSPPCSSLVVNHATDLFLVCVYVLVVCNSCFHVRVFGVLVPQLVCVRVFACVLVCFRLLACMSGPRMTGLTYFDFLSG